MSDAALAPLQAQLGYTFANPALLIEALTHSTYANEHGPRGVDYERLEFLGDAVLSLVVSEVLYARFPGEREGTLSRRRAQLVCEATLAALARQLQLASYVRTGQGQRDEGLGASILADVFEAVVAAVYLDGGLAACAATLQPHLQPHLEAVASSRAQDAKTRLQELCHRRHLAPPRYAVVAEEGPSHGRTFVVQLTVEGLAPLTARGRSKKIAEQDCARQAHAKLTRPNDVASL